MKEKDLKNGERRFIMVQEECEECEGTGKDADGDECEECDGLGYIE